MSDAGGVAGEGNAGGGWTNLAADQTDTCPAAESKSAPPPQPSGEVSGDNKSESGDGLRDSPDEATAAQAVVHFQEAAGAAESDPPKSKNVVRKVCDWCDCDTVWVGCLLVGTGVAFIIFIVFIITG